MLDKKEHLAQKKHRGFTAGQQIIGKQCGKDQCSKHDGHGIRHVDLPGFARR